MINWVGETENWTKPSYSGPIVFTMPLIEEEVLSVAFSPEYENTQRLSKTAAVNCTSRLAQRVALAHTGLNPAWQPVQVSKGVLKLPASCHNNGVHFINDTEHMSLLESHVPELAEFGVHEEFLTGDAYEVDGFISDGNILFFHPLKQTWHETTITKYERVTPPSGLLFAAETAVKAVGLNNCPFCIEFRLSKCQWKVIEVHARLGEDAGLPEILWDENPLDAIEEFARKHLVK